MRNLDSLDALTATLLDTLATDYSDPFADDATSLEVSEYIRHTSARFAVDAMLRKASQSCD